MTHRDTLFTVQAPLVGPTNIFTDTKSQTAPPPPSSPNSAGSPLLRRPFPRRLRPRRQRALRRWWWSPSSPPTWRRRRRPRRRAPSPPRPTLPLPGGGDEEAERGGRRWWRGRTTAAATREDGGGGVLGLILGKWQAEERQGRSCRRGQGRRLHPVRGYGARRAGWSAAEDLEGGLVRAAAADVLGRLVLAVVAVMPEAEHFALSSSSSSGARLSGSGGSATTDVDAK
uniref:Uncharacterized protein n=1 Tax=Oryza sativa subsp. japonica TaxID=39947 RepID=Q7F0Q9_ORYSJ|nr:hypothetical protein [Oryza sativa Japonica Group]BAD30446.1 hypothetical protein [Oryza sativa Japonica Group]